MKINIKKLMAMLFLIGSVASAHAAVCRIAPGNITCGQGTTDSLLENGIVTVSGSAKLTQYAFLGARVNS